MNEYEIGKDVQDLRSRLERLEAEFTGRTGRLGEQGIATRRHEVSGGLSDAPPLLWKLEANERIPPFAASLLRLPFPPPLQFASPPESKTWGCTPEPLIPIVYWDGGGSDEFYRLVNQSYSVFKWTNPNTGTTYATAEYSAQLIASGRAHSYQVGSISLASKNSMEITHRMVGGAPFFTVDKLFDVRCNENSLFTSSVDIDPGQYDLIGGATWTLHFDHILRC